MLIIGKIPAILHFSLIKLIVFQSESKTIQGNKIKLNRQKEIGRHYKTLESNFLIQYLAPGIQYHYCPFPNTNTLCMSSKRLQSGYINKYNVETLA